MQGIIRFLKYIWYVLKNAFMVVSIFIDILGILITYSTNYKIPKHMYSIILVVGFIISNYRIYIDNAPYINMSVSLLNRYPFKSQGCGESYIKLMVNFNLYINNFGNNVGIIEDAIVELIGFSDINDKYLIDKVGVKFTEYFISDEEIFPSLEFMKNKVETEFPILLEPKESINKVLILYIEISGSDKDDYLKTMEWMNDMEFSLKLRTKNNNLEKNKSYKIVVSKSEIEVFRKKEIKSNYEVNKLLEGMDKSL